MSSEPGANPASHKPIKSEVPKVKLVAIAKDEGAYFAEWVFHHRYFGFDGIDIYVNRTSDTSEEVLAHLKSLVPELSYYNADWIDNGQPGSQQNLQYIVYEKALAKEREEGEYNYIMFLDIDEFWTPRNMKNTIQSVIKTLPDAAAYSFGWLNEHGHQQPFSTLNSSVEGQLSPLVKTLFKVSAEVSEISLHLPKLHRGSIVLADGLSFVPSAENRECLHDELIKLRDVMIVHRMFRSQLEYISLLDRGNATDDFPLKFNRGGYNKASGVHLTFGLDPHAYSAYAEELKAFLSEPALVEQLDAARQFVTERYQRSLSAAVNAKPVHLPGVFKVFRGCDEALRGHLIEEIKAKSTSWKLSEQQCTSIANQLQSYSIELAAWINQQSNSQGQL